MFFGLRVSSSVLSHIYRKDCLAKFIDFLEWAKALISSEDNVFQVCSVCYPIASDIDA